LFIEVKRFVKIVVDPPTIKSCMRIETDTYEPPTGAKNPASFVQEARLVGKMMKGVDAEHTVKRMGAIR
jgi:hypothetical protein